jgi:tripartite ATP-independent transporter DctP family solute receptor
MTITISRRTSLAAIAAGGLATLAGPASAATVLRWATVLPADHPETMMMQQIATALAASTSGAVQMQVFPAGQLGSSRDSVESCSTGAIQMVSEGAAQFGQFSAPLSILEAPYLWRDPAHLRRGLDSPTMGQLSDLLATQHQMRIIGATYYGTRQVTSGRRKVSTVADMKGFKLRIPEVDTYRTMAEAWGARPTPIDFGELYLALSQGAVDGEENPLPTIQSAKLNEVQKYLVLTAHILTPRLIAINEATWKSLSPALQSAIKATIATHAATQDSEIIQRETALKTSFAASGMTVITPDVESFRKPVLAVLPAKYAARWGAGLWDKLAGA